jgi:hypothetical protein
MIATPHLRPFFHHPFIPTPAPLHLVLHPYDPPPPPCTPAKPCGSLTNDPRPLPPTSPSALQYDVVVREQPSAPPGRPLPPIPFLLEDLNDIPRLRRGMRSV